jgi:hypothetical protein
MGERSSDLMGVQSAPPLMTSRVKSSRPRCIAAMISRRLTFDPGCHVLDETPEEIFNAIVERGRHIA